MSTVIFNDGSIELSLGSKGSNPLFADCLLDSVYIGRNISFNTSSSSGCSPFYRNETLRSVTFSDKETEITSNEFYGCKNLKNVRIGNGVTAIGDWAFSGCNSLDFFSFGSGLKSIGKEALSDCTAMTRLVSHVNVPPTCGFQALDDINKWNCTLSVPTGCKQAYLLADQWKEFFFINDDVVTGINSPTPDLSPTGEGCGYYTLDGRKLDQMPTQKGVYVVNGHKVVVK